MPEDLNEDQWKDTIVWAQIYPGSYTEYPTPSSICADAENDEMVETRQTRIQDRFRNTLQEFYPIFDTLIKNKFKASNLQNPCEYNSVLDD